MGNVVIVQLKVEKYLLKVTPLDFGFKIVILGLPWWRSG